MALPPLKLGATLARFGAKVKECLCFSENNVIMNKKPPERMRINMKYAVGALLGLLWGAFIAWINSRINKKAIAKNSTKAVLTANAVRMAIDIAGLTVVFLLRNILPFNFEATIAGTAASLGLLTVYFAYRLSRPE